MIFLLVKKDIYIRVDGNKIYRSQDGGRTFVPQMDLMSNFYNEFGIQNFGVRNIVQTQTPGLLYFVGATSKIYWVTNGNGYIEYQTGNNYIADISPHPTNGSLVLRELAICENDPICSTTVSKLQRNKKKKL